MARICWRIFILLASWTIAGCQFASNRCADWQSPTYFANATFTQVEACIRAGKDVHERNYIGNTPVHEAALSGSTDGLSMLLRVGADPNFPGFRGMSPLSYLLRFARLSADGVGNVASTVHMLLEAGADPNLADWRGMTPILQAAFFNYLEVVDALLDAGGDPRATRPGSGHTVLHLLLWNVLGNERPSLGLVERLLAAGADPRARSQTGDTALHFIATHDDPAIVERLLAAGSDVGAPNNYGLTPLHAAAFGRYPLIVKALLDAGADPQASDDRGRTPLHYTVMADGSAATVHLLLQAGSVPNTPDGGGNTALHLAAYWTMQADVIAKLRLAGARDDLRNKQGQTPLQVARTRVRMPPDVLATLAAEPPTPHAAVRSERGVPP